MRKSGTGLDVAGSLASLLPLVYRSVVEDSVISELMTRLGQTIGAEWSVILVHPYAGGAPSFVLGSGIPPAAQTAYDSYFHALEPWPGWSVRAGVGFGKPALSHEMATVAEFTRTEYYHDFWRAQADLLHTAGSLFAIDSESFGHIAFPRARCFGQYPESTKDLISALTPHLGAALGARFQMDRQRLRQRVLERAFDSIEDPVFLLDAHGRTVVANRAAEQWLAQTREVAVKGGRLTLRNQRAQAGLDAVLNSLRSSPAAVKSREFDCQLDGTLAILHLTPLVEDTGIPHGRQACGALIRVTFPHAETEAAVARLAARHGFTATESAVCLAVMHGRNPKLIAAERSVSVATVRSQLKALYAKCGCHNQLELAAMVRLHGGTELR